MASKEYRFPKIISEEEIAKINKTIMTSKNLYSDNESGMFFRWRDFTAINFLIRTGLRPKEALDLKWDMIDFVQKKIEINPFSNKVRCNIPAVLTAPAEQLLLQYKKALEDLNVKKCEHIFPSYWSWKPITRSAFSRRYRDILKEAGILKFDHYRVDGSVRYNYRLYSTRHKFATDVYKAMKDTTAVSKLCRHKSLISSQFYVHLNQDEKKDIATSVFGDYQNQKEEFKAEVPTMPVLTNREPQKVINITNNNINLNLIINLLQEQQKQIDKLSETVFQIVENKEEKKESINVI